MDTATAFVGLTFHALLTAFWLGCTRLLVQRGSALSDAGRGIVALSVGFVLCNLIVILLFVFQLLRVFEKQWSDQSAIPLRWTVHVVLLLYITWFAVFRMAPIAHAVWWVGRNQSGSSFRYTLVQALNPGRSTMWLLTAAYIAATGALLLMWFLGMSEVLARN